MASFSRGLLLPGLRASLAPRTILPELSVFRSRTFTTALHLRAAARDAARTAKPSKPLSARAAPSKSEIPPSRYAFIKSLANKPTPTVLYEAPSHFWFYFGTWTSGMFLLGWTALTAPYVTKLPEDAPQWIGVVYGFAYLIFVAMAFSLLHKTAGIVHSIRLMPRPAAGAAPRPSAALQNPQVEVTVKRMLPFLQPKVATVGLDKVALESRFSLPDEYVPELRRIERRREEEARQAALHKFDMEHLMTMPFRRIGRALRRVFHGIRSAWTDMGFGVIKVDGKSYKVDVTSGFAHDGFRTLERLLH